MLKNIIVLPNGTRISSGVGADPVIQSCTLTECVNSGDELTPGSVCCACLEVKIFTAAGKLPITAGTELRLYKVDDSGAQHPAGVFIAEKPTRSSANIYKITAYDRVMLLDKDLTENLSDENITWSDDKDSPAFRMLEFAGMVCRMCGLELATTELPNADLPIYRIQQEGVTGRQILQWIGEAAGRFCRANAQGKIEFAQYANRGAVIRPTGGRYYFQGALNYEDYDVAGIDGLRYWVDGTLYPYIPGSNPYTIPDSNLVWKGRTAKGLGGEHGDTVFAQLSGIGAYRPCKVSIPACLDVHAGDIVTVVTPDGESLRVLVMTKTQSGQRDTLECTGSHSRGSSTATNNPTTRQVAQDAVSNLTEQDILNKLQAQWVTIDGIGRVLVKKEETT